MPRVEIAKPAALHVGGLHSSAYDIYATDGSLEESTIGAPTRMWELLHLQVNHGFLTFFVKVRAHEEEPYI